MKSKPHFFLIAAVPVLVFMFSRVAVSSVKIVDTIVIPENIADHPAVRLVAQHLADTLEEKLGARPAIGTIAPGETAGGALVIIDRVSEVTFVKSEPGMEEYTARQLADSFRIYSPADTPGEIRIACYEAMGAAYGMAYLADRVRIDPESIWRLDEKMSPAFPLRMATADTPENVLLRGYNISMAAGNHNRVVLLEDVEPDIFKGKEEDRAEVMERREKLTAELDKNKNLGLYSMTSCDEFEFHKALLDLPGARKMTRDPVSNRLCYCNKRVWKYYAAKYKEIMRDFPGIDFVMVRLGENYAKEDYFGNVIAEKDITKYCPACVTDSYEERIATLMNRTYDLVVREGGRKYIHRTWDTNSDTFHSNPDMYSDIISRMNDTDGMITSVKYTKTDFWRYNFGNETIGLPGPKQIVEFQCQREYEGKGAFPNFIGEELSSGYKMARAKGAIGVWNWHHGGGWNGPVPQSDIWNEANIYAASRLAWDPNLDPLTLAREWAAMEFGRENAAGIADILLFSDDAILKLVYFQKYAELKGNPWMPNENWTRDDVIKGEDRLNRIYNVAKDYVDEMIEEKDKGAWTVERMIEIANRLNIPGEKREILYDTLQYELYWARTLRDYSAAYFYYRRWKDTGSESDHTDAAKRLAAWKQNWNRYRTEIHKLKYAASLYNNDGMEELMAKVEAEL